MEQTLGDGPPKAPKAAPSSTRGKSRAMPATAACGGNGGRQLGDGRRKAGETEKSKRLPIWMALKGIRFTLSILIPMKYCVKIAIFTGSYTHHCVLAMFLLDCQHLAIYVVLKCREAP